MKASSPRRGNFGPAGASLLKMPEKSWRVELSRSSLKSLERLDKHVSDKILDRLEELGGFENPLRHKDVRPLERKFKGFLRYHGEIKDIQRLISYEFRFVFAEPSDLIPQSTISL